MTLSCRGLPSIRCDPMYLSTTCPQWFVTWPQHLDLWALKWGSVSTSKNKRKQSKQLQHRSQAISKALLHGLIELPTIVMIQSHFTASSNPMTLNALFEGGAPWKQWGIIKIACSGYRRASNNIKSEGRSYRFIECRCKRVEVICSGVPLSSTEPWWTSGSICSISPWQPIFLSRSLTLSYRQYQSSTKFPPQGLKELM